MMMMLMRVPVKWASAARHSGKKLLPGIWWKTAKKKNHNANNNNNACRKTAWQL